MGQPWMTSVKTTKQLSVYNGIGGGSWANIYSLALDAFNTWAKPVGIKLVKSTDKDQANIVLRLGDGVVKYDYDGTDYEKSFSGTLLHGMTRALARDGMIEKAYVFLPATPQVTEFDNKGNAKEVLASQNVMLVIAVHEFIHAAGLNDNNDHGGDGIFYYPLHYNQKGKLYVPERGKNMTPMPPIRPDPHIAGKLKLLW